MCLLVDRVVDGVDGVDARREAVREISGGGSQQVKLLLSGGIECDNRAWDKA